MKSPAHRLVAASSRAPFANWAAWLPWAVALLAFGVRLSAGPAPVDDAYITFRYADNLAQGRGLVYNPGQSVLGTSAPAFALLLAVLASGTGGAIPWIAVGISAIADAITCLLLCCLALRLGLGRGPALLVALLWALYPLSVRYAIGGMEVSLAAAVLLGSFSLYLSGRASWAALLAGLAFLIRPDAALAGLILLAAWLIETRRFPWRQGLVMAAVALPWLLAATWLYGSPLPHSALAKSQTIYRVAALDSARQILFHLGGLAVNGPLGLGAEGIILVPPMALQRPLLLLAVLNFGLWEFGLASALRKSRRWLAFFAFPLLFVVAYALMGLRSTLMAEWYFVPLAPFFILGIAAGADALLRRFLGRARSVILPLTLGLVVAAQLVGFNLGRDAQSGWFVPRSAWLERERLYREAAAFLRGRLQSDDLVAASEIGALGYYCQCRILDTVGLVSPEALHYYPVPAEMQVTINAVPPDLIRDMRPAYLVSLNVFTRRSVLAAGWFSDGYRLIWERPCSAFGSEVMQIFERVD